jgi:hypothetical protein
MSKKNIKHFSVEEAKRLRKEGMTYKKIADSIGGVGVTTIARRLKGGLSAEEREMRVIKRKSRKKYLIEYKGGECCICGYNKCEAALVFHHLDPEKKSFSIGNRAQAPLKEALKEADKTILLCHNCHSEVHQGLHEEFI